MTLLSKKKILRSIKKDNLRNLDRIYIVKKTSSTNDDAKISLRKDNLKITAFFAEQQTSGRGRNKRNWISPFGKNIYFSFAWKADLNLNQLGGLSLATAVVVAKSFARIHETNLKKQGILTLTFVNENDYDIIQENDVIDILDLEQISENEKLEALVKHQDNTQDQLFLKHTYTKSQIDWFKSGSALNVLRKRIS